MYVETYLFDKKSSLIYVSKYVRIYSTKAENRKARRKSTFAKVSCAFTMDARLAK